MYGRVLEVADMWWMIGAYANLVVALAYLAIAVAIIKPLARDGQLLSNRLATATAAIFVTSAIYHGGQTVEMVLPSGGVGTAMKTTSDFSTPSAVLVVKLKRPEAVFFLTNSSRPGS